MLIENNRQMRALSDQAKRALDVVVDLDRRFEVRDKALEDYTKAFYVMEQAPFKQCPVYITNGRTRHCEPQCGHCDGTDWMDKE